jgi:YVTN family beta-propeller protein
MGTIKAVIVVALALLALSSCVQTIRGSSFTSTSGTFRNLTLDVGQSYTSNIVVSGGSGQYYGQWAWASSNQVNNQVTNSIPTTNYGSPDGMAIAPSGSFAYVAFPNLDIVGVINTLTNMPVDNITVGKRPFTVSINPSGTIAYAVNLGSNNLSVIDMATNTVINSISTGTSSPWDAVFSPDGATAYVASEVGDTLSVIDVAANTVVQTVSLGTSPYGIAINPSGSLLYVTEYSAGQVAVVNTVTYSVVNTIPIGHGAYQIAINPQGTLAYVTQRYAGLSVINLATNTVTATLSGNGAVAFNPQGTLAYVTYWNSALLNVIDVATNAAINTITLGAVTRNGDDSTSIAFTPSGAAAYITDYSAENISVVDVAANTVTSSISVLGPGIGIAPVAFNPVSHYAYITNDYGGIGIINPSNAVTGYIRGPLLANPFSLTFNPSGTLAYISNVTSSESGVMVIVNTSTNAIVNTIALQYVSSSTAISPSGSVAYAVNECGTSYGSCNPGTVSVIDTETNTVINTITVGEYPIESAFNPSGSLSYVPNYGSGTVNVIEVATNAIVNTITVGAAPDFVSFNPSGTIAYVSNKYGVNVIDVAANAVINTIVESSTISGMAFNPSGTIAYAAIGSNNAISVIDVQTNSIIGTVSISNGPFGLAMSPSGSYLYSSLYYDGDVSVIGNLPETDLQSLGNTPAGNGISQLTINAVSSNTLAFSFNGKTYSEGTGGNTVYGNWALYGFAEDSPGVYIGTGGTMYGFGNTITFSNSLTINPPLTASLVYSSNPVSDVLQHETLSASWYGGTAPYATLNWTITNSINGNIIAQAMYSDLSYLATSNSFTFQIPNTANALGTLTAKFSITDSATTPMVSFLANTITDTAPSISITPSATSVYPGQSITLSNTVSGGFPPYSSYSYTVFEYGSAAAGAANVIVTGNRITFSTTGTFNVTESVADSNGIVSYSQNVVISSISPTTTIPPPCGGEICQSGGTGVYNSTKGISGSTTAATTSTAPSVTTTINPSANASVSTANVFIPQNSTGNSVTFGNLGITLAIHPNGQSGIVAVSIRNSTKATPPPPAGYAKISALSITLDNPLVTANITQNYTCASSAGSIQPFMLKNGSWEPISAFTSNHQTCSVTFMVPKTGTVSLMGRLAQTTSIAASQPTTISSSSPAQPGIPMAAALLAVIIAIIVIAAAAFYLRRLRMRR